MNKNETPNDNDYEHVEAKSMAGPGIQGVTYDSIIIAVLANVGHEALDEAGFCTSRGKYNGHMLQHEALYYIL